MHEEERRRQNQAAGDISEEIEFRIDELKLTVSKGERLDVAPALLAQAHEYLAVLGSSMRKVKSQAQDLRSANESTAYRGVSSKGVTLAGVTHKLFEAYFESKFLGTFVSAVEAASAFAQHVHMTYGLVAAEADPFARPDTSAALQAPTIKPAAGLAILSRLAAAVRCPPPGASNAKKYSTVKYAHAAPTSATSTSSSLGKRSNAAVPSADKRQRKQSWTQRSVERIETAQPMGASRQDPPRTQAQQIQPSGQSQLSQPPAPSPVPVHPPPACVQTAVPPSVLTLAPAPAPATSTTTVKPLPTAAPHPSLAGKMRVLSSDVHGVSTGEMFSVALPGCSHTVRIPFPAEACTYITFKFAECPRCRRESMS